jgi:hypothetical protein
MNFLSWGAPSKAAKVDLALNFPNRSRSLDVAHDHVSFWGYSSTIEVTFMIGLDVLRDMAPSGLPPDEGLLETFDQNRAAIEKAASRAFSREHATFCRLNRSDF